MNQTPHKLLGKSPRQSPATSSKTTTAVSSRWPPPAPVPEHHQQLDHEFQAKNNEQEQDQRQNGRARLLRHASATLGSGNLRDVVRLPCGEDQNEWIAANIYDFYRQVSMLYGMIVEHCTDEECPRMTAGEQHEYFWSDSKGNLMEPCPANVYIDYLLNWVQEELDDENIFPSQIGKAFPTNFMHITQTIMKRLFRVYAHVYHQHFQLIEELKAVQHLNTSFKHFMLFVREFDLIDCSQIAPLQELIDKLLPNTTFNTVTTTAANNVPLQPGEMIDQKL